MGRFVDIFLPLYDSFQHCKMGVPTTLILALGTPAMTGGGLSHEFQLCKRMSLG